MKLAGTLLRLVGFCMSLLPVASAGGGDCCKFTLSSSGAFSCPAGQLPDGQIRLNGSEPASTFCINKSGGIVDEKGFGCIVTGAPTTQVQCDENKAPDENFSISSSGDLMYKGSTSFFACPATDIEYNIYVAPNFGQTKCFPITLQASGCGAQTISCPAASTVTVMVTQTQTSGVTVTVTDGSGDTVTIDPGTITETVTLPCSSSTTSRTSCRLCTKTHTSDTTTSTSTSCSTSTTSTTSNSTSCSTSMTSSTSTSTTSCSTSDSTSCSTSDSTTVHWGTMTGYNSSSY